MKSKFGTIQENIMENTLEIATRPQSIKMPSSMAKVDLASNYFRFAFTNKAKNKIFKYSVVYEPEMTDKARRVQNGIYRKIKKEMRLVYDFIVFRGKTFYALENVGEVKEFMCEYDNVQYKVICKWV